MKNKENKKTGKKIHHHLWLIGSITFALLALLFIVFVFSNGPVFGQAIGNACTVEVGCPTDYEACDPASLTCQLDTDNDQVADVVDDCPDSMDDVDKNGCTKDDYKTGFQGLVNDVLYENDEITTASKARFLAELGKELKKVVE